MSADLVSWLLSDDVPIAEDERWARDALMKGDWNGAMRMHDHREPVGQHIARWNPARVLAECAAKRRIIDLWQVHDQSRGDLPAGVHDGRDWDERERDDAIATALDDVVLALAQVYRGRPGWLSEWETA